MNKFNKLSGAILVALLASASAAHAAPAFYGNVDIGVTTAKMNGVTSTVIDSGSSAASIFGVRDTEDLGGGLKAIVQLEGAFKADDGSTNTITFNRDTFAGLTNGMHTIKLGRLKTLNRAALLEYDPFTAAPWGIGLSVMDQNGSFAANSVQYDFASGGINASFQHVAGEQAGAGIQGGSTDAAMARYAAGPLSATISHTKVDNTALVSASTTNTLVGVGYDFGGVKTTLMYQNSNANKANPVDSRVLIGATAPVASNVTLMAEVGQVKMANGVKANLAAVGGKYIMSSRTDLYASFNRSELPGHDGRQLTAGIRHKF